MLACLSPKFLGDSFALSEKLERFFGDSGISSRSILAVLAVAEGITWVITTFLTEANPNRSVEYRLEISWISSSVSPSG